MRSVPRDAIFLFPGPISALPWEAGMPCPHLLFPPFSAVFTSPLLGSLFLPTFVLAAHLNLSATHPSRLVLDLLVAEGFLMSRTLYAFPELKPQNPEEGGVEACSWSQICSRFAEHHLAVALWQHGFQGL